MSENKFKNLARKPSQFKGRKPEPLIDGLFNKDSLTLVYSKTGGMKSWFMMDLTRAITTGDKFLGHQAELNKVIYVDAEQADPDIAVRLEAMGLLDNQNIEYITQAEDAFDFSDPKDKEDFFNYVKDSEIKVIIFDNLRTILTVHSENDSAAFTEINKFLMRLRSIGCAVFMVHHTGKDSSNYAGSSSIAIVYNTIIGLHDSSLCEYRKISIDKNRSSLEGLNKINNQHIRLSGDRFILNQSDLMEESDYADKLLVELEKRKLKSLKEVKSFLRGLGMGISNGSFKAYDVIELLKETSEPHKITSIAKLQEIYKEAKEHPDNIFSD